MIRGQLIGHLRSTTVVDANYSAPCQWAAGGGGFINPDQRLLQQLCAIFTIISATLHNFEHSVDLQTSAMLHYFHKHVRNFAQFWTPRWSAHFRKLCTMFANMSANPFAPGPKTEWRMTPKNERLQTSVKQPLSATWNKSIIDEWLQEFKTAKFKRGTAVNNCLG